MSIKPGSKYYPIFEHLQRCKQVAITIAFSEIEALMGAIACLSASFKNTG